MVKVTLLIIILFSISSCKKDGLSKSTGNIEISIPYSNDVTLNLYTELMFDNFLNFRPNTIYKELVKDGTKTQKDGSTIITFKGIPGGNYGFHLYWWNTNRTDVRVIKKSIIVINNKTAKESLN